MNSKMAFVGAMLTILGVGLLVGGVADDSGLRVFLGAGAMGLGFALFAEGVIHEANRRHNGD